MEIFNSLEKAPGLKQQMLDYDFPTSALYPSNKYPKSRALNYIVNHASIHRPLILNLEKTTMVVTFKLDEWFVAVQTNGVDLESNLDVYHIDHEKFYDDLAYAVLDNHGCSGKMAEYKDCMRCHDCNGLLAVY